MESGAITMPDVVDRSTRSRMMRAIKGRDTHPELALRKYLHAQGYRFRLHRKDLPGSPDLVLPRHHLAIFVHGCFWHRHEGCRYATTPSTRQEFWQRKFVANVARDAAVRRRLLEDGWRVATVWECALRKPDQITASTERLSAWLQSDEHKIEIGTEDSQSP